MVQNIRNLCVKLRIYPNPNWSEDECKQFYHVLAYQSENARKIANETVQVAWLEGSGMPVPYETKDGYQYYCNKYYDMAPANVNQIFRWAKGQYSQHARAVFAGEESLISFREGTPILLNSQRDYKIIDNNGSFQIRARFLRHVNEKGEPQQHLWLFNVANLPRDYEGYKNLKRIAAGELHSGIAKVTKQKEKWYFIVPYKVPQDETTDKDLLDDRIMGIDLGMVNPATYAFTYNGKIQKDNGCIEGDEIIEFRRRIEGRTIAMGRQGKWSNRRGHGRKRLLAPISKYRGKIRNFQETCNKRYANFLVRMAVKHRCKHIQLEDLTGINRNALFLKYWSYYSLQTQIRFQAEKYGIDVKMIRPQYTSQRCPICGAIHKENRLSQDTFICQECGYGDTKKGFHHVNADFNAACNIATPRIDEIIQAYIKDHPELKSIKSPSSGK